MMLQNSIYPFELEIKLLFYVLFCRDVIYTLYLSPTHATHALISHMAVSRVQVARPQLGRRGQLRTEEAEIAIATAFLRRTFSICAVKGQAFSLLGRLEGLGAGVAAAQGRRSQAAQQEQLWRRQRQDTLFV